VASTNLKTRPLQDRTVQAIIHEAEKLGAYAAPVFNRKGQVEEVHLFREGSLRSSVYRSEANRIWVWRPDGSTSETSTIPLAVQRGLDPQRKRHLKTSKTAENGALGLRHAASSEGAATSIPPP